MAAGEKIGTGLIKTGNIGKLRIIFIFGLLAVLSVSPFLRGLYFEAELLPLLTVIAFSFGCCVIDHLSEREPKWFKEPLDWAMLALVMAYLISLIQAVDIHQALVDLLTVGGFLMVYLMAAWAVRNEVEFNRLLLAAYLVGIGLAFAGLGAAGGLFDLPGAYEDGHIRSTMQYHNTLAIYLAALTLAGLALSVRTEKRLMRLAYTAGNLLMTIVILGAISRGTWLVYPIGLLLFIFLIAKEYRRAALAHWVIFFAYGLLGGLGFLNSVNQAGKLLAWGFILTAMFMAVFMQWLVEVNKWCASQPDAGKKYGRFAGKPQVLGIGFIFVLTLLYMLLSFPGGAVQVVPESITAKMEKTSLQDSSINDRLTFDLDALKIARDYPLTGAGGGGWEALYHSYANRLYWSREVHNYYLQTLVEAGGLGLMALLSLAVFFIKLLMNFRQRNRENNLKELTLWGAAAAIVIMALHGGFDADFSLAASGLLFYTLLGAVRGRINNVPAGMTQAAKRKGAARNTGLNPSIIGLSLGVLGALAVGITAGAFHCAAGLGEEGARALEQRDLDKASNLFQQAAGLDPWRSAYLINLARLEAIKADKSPAAGPARQAAIEYASRAAGLDPYNSNVQKELINTYSILHEGDLRITASQALVKADPLIAENYEILAGNIMDAAWYFLNHGHRKQAEIYCTRVLNARQSLPPAAGEAGQVLNLLAGQSSLLLGKTEQGKEYLLQAVNRGGQRQPEAQLWLAAACSLIGDDAEAGSWLNKAAARDKMVRAKYQTILKLLGTNR